MLFAESTSSGPDFFGLVPLIVFIPLAGLLVNLLIGRRSGERAIGAVAILASGFTFVVSLLLAWSVIGHHEAVSVHLLDWIHIGPLQLDWTFRVDSLSVTMMLVVSGIGSLIHIYAASYMRFDVRYKEDPKSYARFFIYLNLFIAFMMILVSGDNYLMLFVGWEGVGLCSFLLIGFWFNRNPDASLGMGNSNAAKKAFITNRIGDFGFLIAMFLTFWFLSSLQFDAVFAAVHDTEHLPEWVLPAIAIFMLIGVAGKSAQIPLYVWLPDAMAGPTPVSALIHAATMVTAGVYLITRSYPIFHASESAQLIVAGVGAVTALFAATIAVGQYDIKRVLAYSTVSQLGFMVAAVGFGGFVAGMFHLITHAFFKALLFLGSGSVILGVERGHHPLASMGDGHAHDDHHDHHHGEEGDGHHEPFDPQDMRNMGGIRKRMPVTFWTYMIGTLALAGLPPLAGFWSKDEILADAFGHGHMFVYIVLAIAAFFTAFYMGRQIFLVFFGEPRSDAARDAKESPNGMLIPLVVLAALALFGGLLNLPSIEAAGSELLHGSHALEKWLHHTLQDAAHAPEFLDWQVAGTSTAAALVALLIAWIFYGRKPLKAGQTDPFRRILGPVFVGMTNKWYVDEIYGFLIIRPFNRLAAWLADRLDWDFWHDWIHDRVIADGFINLAHFLANPIDLGIVDKVSDVLARGTGWLSRSLSTTQNGYARVYALYVFGGVVLIVSYLIFT
jgi:NADH-quinone oxidoreductase subunit L